MYLMRMRGRRGGVPMSIGSHTRESRDGRQVESTHIWVIVAYFKFFYFINQISFISPFISQLFYLFFSLFHLLSFYS